MRKTALHIQRADDEKIYVVSQPLMVPIHCLRIVWHLYTLIIALRPYDLYIILRRLAAHSQPSFSASLYL
jgi:hypothetical protein